MSPNELFADLTARIEEIPASCPRKIAVDGIDAAGKTTIADSLGHYMERSGHEIIRSSIDNFHRPKVARYARGECSPPGYYEDSFDYEMLTGLLLEPLASDNLRQYRRRAFDLHSDEPIWDETEQCHPSAVLLFDGVFLLRPELNLWWDYRIFIDTSFEIALERAFVRDAPRLGDERSIEDRYRQRYFAGQKIYFDRVNPKSLANIVICNDDPSQPRIVEAFDTKTRTENP
ncbi:MAG: hypothetical protein GDA50_06925 [Alphaproteobacteria bacterium GM202ARS2]|nr:hypothetical protein [Alphaproteobacteria bacterium GM202ARS2]